MDMVLKKSVINIDELGRAGPYSHAVRAGNLLFLSGMIGLNNTGKNSFEEQFRSAMNKISKILESAGSSTADIVKMTVYLSDQATFKEMNGLFQEYFRISPPARTTIVCGFVVPDALVELDAVAMLSSDE